MKALRFETYGPPSVLGIAQVPRPQLRPGEVLVEVRASAINPSDVKNIAGAFQTPLPRVPGRDFAGVVVEGGGAQWNGKAVWGSGAGFGVNRDGSHAEYLAIPLRWLSEKPHQLSMEEAACVGIPYIVSWMALVDAARLQASDTVLIIGAAGAVGQAATQIARWRGATVIGAVRSDTVSDTDLRIETRTHDLTEEVRRLTASKGVDVVLDTVGGPMFEPALKSLGCGGRQVAIASAGNPRVEFNLVDFYHGSKRLIGIDSMKLGGEEVANILDKLRDGFAQGQLNPPAFDSWALDRGVEAFEAVVSGGRRAKQVLLPND